MGDINKPSMSLKEDLSESEEQQHGSNIVLEQQTVIESLKTEENSKNKVNHDNDKGIDNKGLPEENKENRQCDPCLFDNVKENANSFCVVCVEYLCKACARDHRRSKATRNHKVLMDTEMPEDPKIFKLMKSLVSCSDHSEMEVSFKCKTHEKFICTKCLVVSHRKCEDVTEISNQIANEETSASTDTLTFLPNKLQSVYEMTVSVRNAKEENIKQLQIDSSCIQTERSDYIKGLQEQLLKLDEISKSETESLLTKSLGELEEDVNMCKKIEMKEIEEKSLLDVAMKYGNTTEVNIICDKVEKCIKEFKNESIQQGAKAIVSLKFERNQIFKDISSIGSICVESGKNRKDDKENLSNKETVLEFSSEEIGVETLNVVEDLQCKPLMQSSVSKRRCMFDVQSTFSKMTEKCSVSSILILSDGIVVLTDYSNKRIKVLNSDFTLRTEKELHRNPIDMCQCLKNKLAIIFDGVKCITKYWIIEENIPSDKEFPCKLYPISIGGIPDNDEQAIILFSDEERKTQKKSDYDQIEIQIRNVKDGQILRTFSEFKKKSSMKMVLENPGRLCMKLKAHNTILISENMRLHCVEPDQVNENVLKEKWYFKSYKENEISGITDIAVDKEGNIYVCGKDSKNIHQISSMNYMKNRVLCTVTGTPMSLCVDDDQRQLIVGCEEDDFIYVIKLE